VGRIGGATITDLNSTNVFAQEAIKTFVNDLTVEKKRVLRQMRTMASDLTRRHQQAIGNISQKEEMLSASVSGWHSSVRGKLHAIATSIATEANGVRATASHVSQQLHHVQQDALQLQDHIRQLKLQLCHSLQTLDVDLKAVDVEQEDFVHSKHQWLLDQSSRHRRLEAEASNGAGRQVVALQTAKETFKMVDAAVRTHSEHIHHVSQTMTAFERWRADFLRLTQQLQGALQTTTDLTEEGEDHVASSLALAAPPSSAASVAMAVTHHSWGDMVDSCSTWM